MDDDEVTVPIEEEGECMSAMPTGGMPQCPLDFFTLSLIEGRDRSARNANTLDHILGLGFASSDTFRDSLAYRTASEAGGGQTRAQTVLPGPFHKDD